jgi:hypothetical protein
LPPEIRSAVGMIDDTTELDADVFIGCGGESDQVFYQSAANGNQCSRWWTRLRHLRRGRRRNHDQLH